jgi:hypothetical protein
MAKGKKTGGRGKGTPNKATADVRAAIAGLLEHAAPRMVAWLDDVAAEDPGRAMDIVTRLAEYHIPKLARTEQVGDGGGPVQINVVSPFR